VCNYYFFIVVFFVIINIYYKKMWYALFIVLLILIIAFLGYRMLMKPDHERIINKLGDKIWLVDKSGVGGGSSFYVKFGKFEIDSKALNPGGKVTYTQYGQDKGFEYDATLEWAQAGDSLRVGQMKLSLTAGKNGLPPTIMYTNNVEDIAAWVAPLKDVDPPSKKL
jgi:energy-coupling factor transporter transmembrane protein EcfT